MRKTTITKKEKVNKEFIKTIVFEKINTKFIYCIKSIFYYINSKLLKVIFIFIEKLLNILNTNILYYNIYNNLSFSKII